MSRIIPLAEILEMSEGETIVATKGRLIDIRKLNRGTNKNGDWTIQNATIESNGTKMDLFLKDREELSMSWKGRDIYIEANHGEKGWTGVYAMDDDYRATHAKPGQAIPPIERKIKVTPTASISLLEGEPAQTQQRAQQPAQTQQRQQPPPPAREQQQQPADFKKEPCRPQQPQRPATNIPEVIASATQVMNLQLICLKHTAEYVKPFMKEVCGVDMDAAALHAWAMNACIQLERTSAQFNLPTTRWPIPARKPEPQPEPPRPANLPADAVWDDVNGAWRDADGNFVF